MTLLEKAFLLASALHAQQMRKASIVPGAPYLSHLMEVAGMVLANGGSETEAAAALLHDAVEDVGDKSRLDISSICGPEVLALVDECTEAGTGGAVKASWQDRKRSYLDHIAQASPGALLISVADKLQSARELKRQVRLIGDLAYEPFVKKECTTIIERKSAVLWFHASLVLAYGARWSELDASTDLPMLVGIKALIDDLDEVVANLTK